jgi:hypothetical protein
MQFRKRAGIALIVSAMAGTASGEPVRITGGGIFLDFEGDFFHLSGDGFDIHGGLDGAYFPLEPVESCFPCHPGDILDLSFSTPGDVGVGSGQATFAGQSYPELFYRAELRAAAAPITFPDTSDAAITFRSPFVLTGSIRAFLDPAFSQLAFRTALRGHGYARSNTYVRDDGGGGYSHLEGQVGYLFQEAAPVPEPATMVLAGLGLAALAARRVRARPHGRRAESERLPGDLVPPDND